MKIKFEKRDKFYKSKWVDFFEEYGKIGESFGHKYNKHKYDKGIYFDILRFLETKIETNLDSIKSNLNDYLKEKFSVKLEL